MRSSNMVQFRHARDVPFCLLMIIGIIAFAAGLSPAEAKHDGWGIRASTAGAIRASIGAGTSTVGEIRVGTWAGISTHGSIRAGIEVPALARPKCTRVYRTRSLSELGVAFLYEDRNAQHERAKVPK
jgi:hypothetical protein